MLWKWEKKHNYGKDALAKMINKNMNWLQGLLFATLQCLPKKIRRVLNSSARYTQVHYSSSPSIVPLELHCSL